MEPSQSFVDGVEVLLTFLNNCSFNSIVI